MFINIYKCLYIYKQISDFSQMENTHIVSNQIKKYCLHPGRPWCSFPVVISQG